MRRLLPVWLPVYRSDVLYRPVAHCVCREVFVEHIAGTPLWMGASYTAGAAESSSQLSQENITRCSVASARGGWVWERLW